MIFFSESAPKYAQPIFPSFRTTLIKGSLYFFPLKVNLILFSLFSSKANKVSPSFREAKIFPSNSGVCLILRLFTLE